MRFAQIGYGHGGEDEIDPKTGKPKGGRGKGGYTYIVSDNVRPDQVLQVIAHSRNSRAFPTTGQVLSTSSAQPSGVPAEKPITNAYTNKELGVKSGFGTTAEGRQEAARYNALAVYNKEALGGLTGEDAEKKLAITGGTKTESLMNNKYESYADYIKRTKPWGGE